MKENILILYNNNMKENILILYNNNMKENILSYTIIIWKKIYYPIQ